MASITLTVTVTGGVPPVQIQVQIFENGNNFCTYSNPNSFTHSFDGLTQGKVYDIYIGGFNPAGGSTECSITYGPEFKIIPPDPTPITSNGVRYNVEFHLG